MQATHPSQNQINILVDLYQSGYLKKTEATCKKILKSHPHAFLILNILGLSLQGQNKLQEALQVFGKAIKFKSDYLEAINNYGVVLQKLGNPSKAIKNYDQAICLNPNDEEIHNNRGVALKDLGRSEEAIQSYDKAIKLKPDYAQAYNNRGVVLNDLGQLGEAVKSYDKAIKLKSDYAQAYNNRGVVLKDLGQLEESIKSYDKAIKLKPGYSEAYSNLIFTLNYSSKIAPINIFYKHLEFNKRFSQNIFLKNKSNREIDTKLKIGYVSADFRAHSVAYFFESLLKSHDKHLVEVYCYYNNTREDSTTKRLIDESEHWRSIVNMSDKDVVSLIKQDDIDILVDLSGHTANNRLTMFAYKPAPIQVTWLGYPNTTGLSAIDYRFTDDIADPVGDADNLHSEKLIRLPNGFLCYQGNELAPMNDTLPSLEKGYITFGSFNNLSKITHETIEAWVKVLQSVSNSHILLKSKQFSDAKIKLKYLDIFKQEGISKERIELYSQLPKTEDHLALYNSIDVGLDPFPYNGTTTTCEALWMGVPTITMSGDRHSARVGASIMNHIGLKEFIAFNVDEYVDIAVKFAKNVDYLAKLRGGLRRKMQYSALCDNKTFASNIEQAYKTMWNQYLHKNL